ncbi:MAG: hypothetical protein KME46_29030 [Brasilonema angustatum HA4187-MV1]|jgi:hypothetical protein|nr:hypothetical protein [Brasilonema angustatum HA4187-MV1]
MVLFELDFTMALLFKPTSVSVAGVFVTLSKWNQGQGHLLELVSIDDPPCL